VVKDLPKRVEQAILRGLSARPEDRFASMRELIAQINVWRRKPSWRRYLLLGGISSTLLAFYVVAFAVGHRSHDDDVVTARGSCAVAFASQSTPRVDPIEIRVNAHHRQIRTISMNGCQLLVETLPTERHLNGRYRILPGSVCDWDLPTYGLRKFSVGNILAVPGSVRIPAEEAHVDVMDREIRVVFDVSVPEGPIWFQCDAVR
jgi:hypothetical protein